MTVISLVVMYALMYAMVNTFENVYMNVNQFYMAGLMAASMVIIEVAIMRAMYDDKRLNVAIILASFIALAGFWAMIRQQTAVSDRQFLRSMIPHHGGAILMCTKAPIRDAEIKSLLPEHCVGPAGRNRPDAGKTGGAREVTVSGPQ